MEQQKVDMFIMSNTSKLPGDRMIFLREHLLTIDDSKWGLLATISFKDPITALLLSLFVGGFGADRFYLGDTMKGILKLITCGGFGIWTIIDWFLILNATKEHNFEKLQTYLY